MSRELRDQQHQRLCEVLRQSHPTGPTLCAGWNVHDLAVHLWSLNHDPVSWLGIVVAPLATLTARRADAAKVRYTYDELVGRIAERADLLCMPEDRLEGYRHSLAEYFIHTEDILRAGGSPVDRSYSPALQGALWKRLKVAARQLAVMYPERCAGVQFRSQYGAFRAGFGTVRKQVSGTPAELLLWASGRQAVAEVHISEL